MVQLKNIKELREIFIRKYTNSNLQSELEKACSEEYELKRDYNGRQILELLQNVDDSCEEIKSHDDIVVKISYIDGVLEVGNTGTTFSEETIERLCLGRASEKSSKKIGNKGTGVRSLLNDAEWVEIHSGKVAIRFSEKFTQELFDKYRNDPLIATQLKNWKKDYNLCFPIMNCPEDIEFNSECFDTLIRVKIKSENNNKETSIIKQLEQPFYKSLLFLPNITKIVIKIDTDMKEYSKISDGDDVLIEKKINSEKYNCDEEYFVYKHKAFIDDKESDLIIAIPKDENYDFAKEKLYCYFPIRNFPAPIHALIHAPFSTNNSRDDVPDDSEQINKKIFISILYFIKNVSEKITLNNTKNLAIKTVVPFFDSKLWSYDFFNLKDKYFEILSTAKILPTVNKNFISIKDSPKIFDFAFPSEFAGDSFNELIIHLDNDNNKLIKKLADFIEYSKFEYTENELAEKISNISSTADIKTRVKLFLWWNEHYKATSYIPKLLKDTNNNWISKTSKVYLPTDGGVSVLPKELSWVKLCILRQDYVSEIIFQLKENRNSDWNKSDEKSQSGGDKRTLAAFSRDYFSVPFIEQSSHEQIISTINQQIESVEKSTSFINWFFERYGKDLKEGSELSKVNFRLPSRYNEVVTIDKLYIGKEYDNQIAEKLFQNTDIKPLADLNVFYTGEEENEFILFLIKCGIHRFPKIYEGNLWNEQDFRNLVSKKYVTHININYLFSKTITNFKNIIQHLETKEIVEWLDKDENLKNLLISIENGSYAKQQSNWYPYYFPSNAYIKFILNKTPWIEFDGIKYPPCRIIKYDKVKNKIAGYYGISEQELLKYLGKDIVQNFELDFKESIADISDGDIKLFLDKLPAFDSGEISRKLYLDIIKSKKGKKPSYSTSDIQLLCKDGKFYKNAEIKYADRKISKSEEKNGNFIYIQPKQSIETIKDWLGVERYKTSLKLEGHTLLDSKDEFNEEIKNIKISMLCIIDSNNNNVNALKRMEVIPCTEIEISDLEQENIAKHLEDYFYIQEENCFYIKIPDGVSISEIRKNDIFALSLIDIFKQALTLSFENEAATLIELLISKDTKSKKQKIEDVYGVDKWNSSYELLYNKNFTNEQVVKFFSENKLRQDLLHEISKINFADELDTYSYKILLNALQDISKDIKDLNECSETININLIPFFESEMEILRDAQLEKYRINLYYKIRCKTKAYIHFLNEVESYKNFDTKKFKFENSTATDLNKLIVEKFPELNDNCSEEINPDITYNNNVEKIISDLNISKDDFDYFIQNHKDKSSVLYFEIPKTIFEDVKTFLAENDSVEENETANAQVTIETSTIQTNLKRSNSFLHEPKIRNCRIEKSKTDYQNKNSQNENAGNIAEKIAYNELKKTYKNLIWHSKYSHNPADRNNPPPNGIVCDMWFFDSEKGNIYFEVKSSTREFDMSINEYESMKKNKENYEVVLVNVETQEISRHKFSELEEFKQINSYVFKFVQEKIQ